MDPDTQLELFSNGVQLLGSLRNAADRLGISERHMARLCSGKSALHQGLLRDMAQALLDRADECRQLERSLSPAFAANLTPQQRERPAHGNAGNRHALRDPED